MYDNELAHFGVKGMRWGVRRDRVSKARSEKKAKKQELNKLSKKNKARVKRTNVSKLTDAELKDRVNRMNLEQQYKRLKPGPVIKGSKMLGNFGLSIAKDIVREEAKDKIKQKIRGNR